MDDTGDALEEIEISYLRTDTGQRDRKKDFVTVEEPLHIIINRDHYATILLTPAQKKELAIGHLITEGIIKNLDEIKEIRIEGQRCRVTLRSDINSRERIQLVTPFRRIILSACSSPDEWPLYKLIDRLKIPKAISKIRVDAKTISVAVRRLNKEARIYRKTGGVHAAALQDLDGKIIAFAEDIGRHNAVDKVIGAALIENRDCEKSFLTSTGRITGDIALKAARVKIPIVASLAAAVSSGIEIAKRTEITLIGFVRGNHMNIYTYPERIK